MSSALKPVLTPTGAQNPPVPSQMNKPMHPQGAPTTYGQPMSHMPQNLVNIAHNAPSSTNVHNPAHSNAHHININAHGASHAPNHYSLNVPNASQHYSVSGNAPVSSHPAPTSNHPVSNVSQAHTQPVTTTYTSPPKNLTYNPPPNYQGNLGHSYKMPNASASPATQTLPATQPPAVTATPPEEPTAEKPQSNGTPEVKPASKPEPPQNHVPAPSIKDKPQPPPPPPQPPQAQPRAVSPEKPPVVAVSVTPPTPPAEQKLNAGASKPSELVSTASAPSDKASASTGLASLSAPNASNSPKAEAASSLPTNVSPSPVVSVAPTSAGVVAPPAASAKVVSPVAAPAASTAPAAQPAPQQAVNVSVPEPQESQDSPVNVPAAIIINKPKEQNQKSTLKLATTPRTPLRKAKAPKPEAVDSPKPPKSETKSPTQKSPGSGGKTKRTRTRTQPYQSPLPEVEMISKISVTTPRNRNSEDKLIIFYKNEFLAVRNSEGGFYICQAVQNIYKSSPRIRIRWLSQDKGDKEVYSPDFYDYTDFDCILTNLNLSRVDKGKYKLPPAERVRTDSILKRALAVEKGDATPPSLTEEHPDGLDLSLYKEESQLKKRKSVKRKASGPLKTANKSGSGKKYPDQHKVRKVISKPRPPPVSKSTVLKRALSAKVKKLDSGRAERAERAAKRRSLESPKNSTKTSPVIDQKKAKVLAKVARKVYVAPPPKPQPPPPPPPSKQNAKVVKQVVAASSSKKPVVVKKEKPVAVVVTRKSKRGKK